MNINSLIYSGDGAEEHLGALHSAGWEIAAHGQNHADSIAFLKNHTSEEWLDQEILPNIVEITGYGCPVYSFAYPYSERNEITDALLAPYFRTLRSTNFGTVNVNESAAYYKWDDTQVLYAVEIDDNSGASLESIKYGIDYAMDNGYVLVLYGHAITPTVTGDYQTSTARLDAILNYTYQKGGVFYHMEDLGNSSWMQGSPRSSTVTANFTVSTDSMMAGENVTFVDYSINQIGELLDFGDGSAKSSTADVVHTYTTPGTYTATLTVTNNIFIQSMTKTITVIQPLVANFTSNPTTGLSPLNVVFTDTSTGFPSSWSWNFGDGSTSNNRNPTHTYSAGGNYNVNLTVSNENGTNSKTAVIIVLQLPVADFSTSATGGYAPLSVLFTDLSQNATSRSWDVNNDGVEDSNETSFVYEYASAGTYTANLTAINANGTNSKTVQIIVDRRDSGSSHSSGGGGGSPEPATNVKVKELSQAFITNGNPVQFNFPKNATAVVYLSFDSKKTFGKTTTIVEMLKNKSKLTPETPEGEVYNYLNIWVGNGGYATEKNIENAVVCFKIEKAWMKDKGIDQSSIILNRYSDKKWNPLPTSQSGDDEKYMYFTTETPGFSSFAITGEITAKETVTEILPIPDTQNLEQNNTDSEVEETSEPKEKTGMPGFEMIYCIIGLLGVFLYRRR
ncbi:hypothetical protein EO92_05800 [Methanosarcina sp. 2.H.A.1B.4]|nr:PGF-pre-PGF domain-containing protein [Methanosarcina sp. 2.H.A.1B.4]KKG12208.1 hypothetical protein EO92_05800 [Methanosarcina sp. 2.H.A.1B.4]